MTWTFNTVADDGSADLTLKVDRVRTRIIAPTIKIEYDSKSGKKPESREATELHEVMKVWVGAEFGCRMSPTGGVSDVRVPASLMKQLPGQDEQQGGPPPVTEETVKTMITGMSLPLPKDDLQVGKTWSQRTQVPTPPAGSLVINTTFQYAGQEKVDGVNAARVDLESLVSIELPPKAEIKPVIKSQKGTGVLYFDQSAGRILKSSSSERFETDVVINGMTINQVNDTTTSLSLAKVDSGGN
jgi:hypothetical protein